MPEGYYRTGAAAKELNISTYHLRKLAESGSIEADYTGRQWRFPASEIARLQREGVPPIPTTAEPEHRNPQPAGHRSEELAEEDPEVVESATGVKIMGNTVQRRKLDRELEETEDWFRARDEREAERQAERDTVERERREPVLGIGSAVQGGLDPLDPQHLEVIQRLLPVLNGFPLGDHVPQRQVPSHATKGVRQ